MIVAAHRRNTRRIGMHLHWLYRVKFTKRFTVRLTKIDTNIAWPNLFPTRIASVKATGLQLVHDEHS